MVRRTRVNCRICKRFDGNDVCDKCYNKLEKKLNSIPIKKVFRCDLCGDTVDNYEEKNLCYKCSKEFGGGYKKLGREYIIFPLYIIAFTIFAFSGAIILGNFSGVFSFSNWIFSVNLDKLFSGEIFLSSIALIICVLFSGSIIDSLYIKNGDD